jgi:hypothetical protein
MDWDTTTWMGAIFTCIVVPVCFWIVIMMDRNDDDDSGMT